MIDLSLPPWLQLTPDGTIMIKEEMTTCSRCLNSGQAKTVVWCGFKQPSASGSPGVWASVCTNCIREDDVFQAR